MEQRNTEREPHAHDEVLDLVGNDDWHGSSNRVHNLRHAPVQVKQQYATERQGQTAESQGWDVPIPEAEDHARCNNGCPYCCEGDVEDPYAIPSGRLRRKVVDCDAVHGETEESSEEVIEERPEKSESIDQDPRKDLEVNWRTAEMALLLFECTDAGHEKGEVKDRPRQASELQDQYQESKSHCPRFWFSHPTKFLQGCRSSSAR